MTTSPPDSPRTAESIVREKHRLENEIARLRSRLEHWRAQFVLFTRQELELECAKGLDRVASAPGDKELKFKLLYLTLILESLPGGHHPSGFKRLLHGVDAPTVTDINVG